MSESSRRPPAPLAPLGVAVAVLAVVAGVLALVRPWGDIGVDARGALVDGRPGGVLATVGIAVALAVGLTLATARGDDRRRAPGRAVGSGALLVVVGAGAGVAVVVVLRAQVLPRDGGWWALLATVAVVVAGVAVVLTAVVRTTGRRSRIVVRAVTVVVPVGLVVIGAVVAPGWSGHLVDGRHPDAFRESPGPTSLGRVAWQQQYGDDTAVAVLGGRVVVARDLERDGRCRLDVRALDAGTGEAVWTVDRPLRCDGPRLAAVDGDNIVVRLTLRGDPEGGDPLTGPALTSYLELESGRALTPLSALDDVSVWTEGFGLVLTGAQLQGLDPRTGTVRWSRSSPRCADGRSAQVALPAPVPTGVRGGRSPYDGAGPHGAVPVVGAGNDVVLGTTCAEGGTTVRSVWLIDVTAGPGADRTVALPDAVALGAVPGAVRAGPDVPTSFLPWLDAVVAVVPVEQPDTPGTVAAGLVGIDLADGRIAWQRAATRLSAVDLSPVDGAVHASGAPPQFGETRPGDTVELDVHTGALLAERADPVPVVASVALVGGRVDLTAAGRVVPGGSDGFTACVPAAAAVEAPVLAGPGGVVVRCDDAPDGGTSLLGLVP